MVKTKISIQIEQKNGITVEKVVGNKDSTTKSFPTFTLFKPSLAQPLSFKPERQPHNSSSKFQILKNFLLNQISCYILCLDV